MPIVIAAKLLFSLLWKWGPTTVTLIDGVLKQVEQMKHYDDRLQATVGIVDIMISDKEKREKIDMLQALACEADKCEIH